MQNFSTRIKDAGIAIRHSRGSILFYTAGSGKEAYLSILQGPERKHTFLYCRVQKWVGGGGHRVAVTQKGSCTQEKTTFSLWKNILRTPDRSKNDVPDLLEAIMRPTCLVKEELRPISFKMNQFGSKILKIKVSTFWIPEIRCFPAGGQCQASRPLGFKQF